MRGDPGRGRSSRALAGGREPLGRRAGGLRGGLARALARRPTSRPLCRWRPWLNDVFQVVSYEAIARDLEPLSRWELAGVTPVLLRRLIATHARVDPPPWLVVGEMDLRIFTEPQQGATYDQLLRIAKATEDLGFSAFFRSDHYLSMGGDGLPGPSDAWTTLAGLARDDQPDPARHADDQRDVPAARAAGDPGGPGRPDERRARGAGPRRGLVRARARGLRHPVPGDRRALRPVRGAARDHHRAVGDPRGRDFSHAGDALLPDRLTGPAQARAEPATPGDHRRAGQASYARAHRALRRRVQPAVRLTGGDPRAVRPGGGGPRARSAGTRSS